MTYLHDLHRVHIKAIGDVFVSDLTLPEVVTVGVHAVAAKVLQDLIGYMVIGPGHERLLSPDDVREWAKGKGIELSESPPILEEAQMAGSDEKPW